MLELGNKNKLLALMHQGATVITPNNRLSAALLQDFFTYNHNKILDKPTCLPYSTFITNVYHQLRYVTPQHPHPTLLSPAQFKYLWQKIIKSETKITSSDGLVKAVIKAYESCLHWEIHSDDHAFHYTSQTKRFQQWWQAFEQKLHEMNLITEYQLIPYLLYTNHPIFDQPIIWACFDEFNPQQINLQDYLKNQGVTQYHYDIIKQSELPQVLAAKDSKDEYQQLISWLNIKLEQGFQRIGVVIPNLQQESRSLQRLLKQHFSPRLFNVSLGQPLSDFPLVSHALSLLQLDINNLSYHQASLFLQSPYLGSANEELTARSHYLQNSTLLQTPRFSLKTLSEDLEAQVPKLSALLKCITPYPESTSIHEWIHLFQERLNFLIYPGDYELNSQNYQCFNKFTAVFDEFRQFSLINDTFTVKEALDIFIHLTDNTIFQAQKKNTVIQISGLLEASGCEFDCLWVMGLTDQCLPQKIRLSAFIPPQLQRQLCMPHSVPDRELQFAKQTLQRLQNGSADTVFSYPKLQGDTPNLPCSLINEFPDFAPLHPINESLNPIRLIKLEENYCVPLENGDVSGGTALLANQAKCPFKAFAEHRLKAKPYLNPVDGLDNKEKGQLIHKVMELLWSTLVSQEQLLSLNTKDLEELIVNSINTALTSHKQLHLESFPTLIQEIEYLRLKQLVLASLDWEKARPPFIVTAIEESYSINLSGLSLKVRVDRLDQVADKKWVIDYKSTLPTTKPWNEERPREPQLLLYALLDEHINTLLLLQLKGGKITCSGFSEVKPGIVGITSVKIEETWEDYKKNWQQQLTLLAQEFQKGYCPPQPLNSSICQHCDFQNLCRFQINQ